MFEIGSILYHVDTNKLFVIVDEILLSSELVVMPLDGDYVNTGDDVRENAVHVDVKELGVNYCSVFPAKFQRVIMGDGANLEDAVKVLVKDRNSFTELFLSKDTVEYLFIDNEYKAYWDCSVVNGDILPLLRCSNEDINEFDF